MVKMEIVVVAVLAIVTLALLSTGFLPLVMVISILAFFAFLISSYASYKFEVSPYPAYIFSYTSFVFIAFIFMYSTSYFGRFEVDEQMLTDSLHFILYPGSAIGVINFVAFKWLYKKDRTSKNIGMFIYSIIYTLLVGSFYSIGLVSVMFRGFGV